MPQENKYTVQDSAENGTPSTASRIKPGPLDNAFPTPPRREGNYSSISKMNGQHSPAPSRMFTLQRAASTPPEHTSGSLRSQFRSRGHSAGLPNNTGLEHSWRQKNLSKKTSQYFDGAFAARGSNNTAKERVTRDSNIIAEVKLNCCLEAHQDFLIDLSFQLSEVYQKPISSIMVMVSTGVHVMLDGTSEPAYCLTITALSSEVAATKNKRTTHLLQSLMYDTLHIPASRGVMRFNPVPEANLAANGVTALQEIEKIEIESQEEKSFVRAISRQTHRMSKKSCPALTPDRGQDATFLEEDSTIPGPAQMDGHQEDTIGPLPLHTTVRRRMKSRKSIMAFFKRGRSESGG